MAPIKRRGPRGGLVSTRLPVYTLNSVSTQAANKRLPNEAERMDNALVSLERAFEKRPGFEVIPQYTIESLTQWDFTNNNTKFDLYALTALDPSTNDLWYYWHNISEIARFLVVVNFSASSTSVNLFYVYQLLPNGTWKDVTPGGQTTSPSSVVPAASRQYITYNPNNRSAADSLKAVSVGANIIILNTNVYAGFSSDTAGKLFTLGGVVTTDDDIVGRPITYWSSSVVTRKTTSLHSTTFPDGYERTTSGTLYIDVTDFTYHVSSGGGGSSTPTPYAGQNVDDITEIRLPPHELEPFANNSNLNSPTDTKAAQMLRVLYDPSHPFYNAGAASPTGIYGRGKIYYFNSPYLDMPSGYYRVINFEKGLAGTSAGVNNTFTGTGSPYLQRVRTPDEHSYIDPRRMPVRMTLTVDASGTASNWSINAMPWTPRLSGTKDTNPGPSVFKTSTGALKHVQIKAISVFKNRLWFAAEDGVFSTQLNNFENLFIEDPTNIVDTDPIDIRTSSNTYNEIISLTPFRDFLFVNTKGNTQFQLMAGSANELTPTNVMIKPISYYATDGKIEPQLIGSQLYFYDAEKLYLFVGENSFGYASAVEVSSTASGYLPSNYLCATAIQSKDTIAVVDGDVSNNIYLYTARFSGDRVVQSSFYRYILDLPTEGVITEVKSLASFGDYLYAIVYNNSRSKYFMYRTKITNEDYEIPRLDALAKIKLIPYNAGTMPTNWNAKYDTATGLTTFRMPSNGYSDQNARIVLASGWTAGSGEDISYTVFNPIKGSETTFCELTVTGNYATADKYIYVGRTYKMHVELSTLFVRDENNNIIDGVLNIRTGVFRHYKTGNYDIEVVHNGRQALVSKFTAPRPDLTSLQDTLPLEPYESQGEFVAKIFGQSDTSSISIVSEYPTPCNITNMEFKGKFKQKYTTLS
jgi:hypothetical protein